MDKNYQKLIQTSLDSGDEFRDHIADLLQAAGHKCYIEKRENFKKVDILCEWHDNFYGKRTLLVEVKNHSGTLRKKDCIDFLYEYKSLIESKKADAAWLISRGPISPDGKELIDSEKNISCFTYHEFQKRIMDFMFYLKDFLSEYEEEKIEKTYINSRTTSGDYLEDIIEKWISYPESNQLAVIGNYGVGKSTFAKHLTAKMAREALESPTERIPILFNLGEIYDEQSVSGLIGKHLASNYRVHGYHFKAFQKINKAGGLLLIFDGLDEMKDGMTLPRFERILSNILELDEGNAKILLFGRSTLFHNNDEYERIIHGRKTTPSGEKVQTNKRRPLDVIEMDEFSHNESLSFIKNNLKLRIRSKHPGYNSKDIELVYNKKMGDIFSHDISHLLRRPVHAQMLCEISADRDIEISQITLYGIYNNFFHLLTEREIVKKGRYPEFDNDVRRKFNIQIAWWLWNKSRDKKSIKISDIPDYIYEYTSSNTRHNYDKEGLRRELIAGCFVDKDGEIVHYRHRSLQEFLISEYAFECIQSSNISHHDASIIMTNFTKDICSFLLNRLEDQKWPDSAIGNFLKFFYEFNGCHISLFVIDMLITMVGERLSIEIDNPDRDAWDNEECFEGPRQFLLWHFIRINKVSFIFSDSTFLEKDIFFKAMQHKCDVRYAAIALWGYSLQRERDNFREMFKYFVHGVIFRNILDISKNCVHEKKILSHCMAVERHNNEYYLEINLQMIGSLFSKEIDTEINGIDDGNISRNVGKISFSEMDSILEDSGNISFFKKFLEDRLYRNWRVS